MTAIKTINLAIAHGKIKTLASLLDSLHEGDGLDCYHAAKKAVQACTLIGVSRRFARIKKELKNFTVMVSVADDDRGIPTVRLFAPTVRTEVFF